MYRKSNICWTSAKLLLPIAVLLLSGAAQAQLSHSSGKRIDAFQVDEAPVLDGVLDDDAWAFATVIEDVHQVDPAEYDPPSESSRFFIVYTKDAMYVAGRFYDDEPDKIGNQNLRQGDFSFGDDTMTVVIDSFNQGRSGYAFDLSSTGVRNQALYSNVTQENWTWDGIWHGVSKIDEKGWVAEMRIPFKTLSFDPRNDIWGLNVGRYIGRKGEQIAWSSANRSLGPAVSGKITGMQGMEQGWGLDIVPGLRTGQSRDYLLSETSSDTKPTLDAFYKITSALTAALTVNTDFSGTGADPRQINLTRFGLFFPERRTFFLQDADIFEFGRITAGNWKERSTVSAVEKESGRPFFSRRIGLTDDGETVDINVGGKLTGRAGPVDIGVLAISQDGTTSLEPSDLFVARFAANVLAESSIGMIFTHGDPNSDLDNTLAGLDFRYTNTQLSGNRTVEAAAWYQQSETEGIEGDDAAWGISLKAPNAIGFRAGLTFKELQANFNPALGFVNRTNVRDLTGELGYTWLPRSRHIREFHMGADYQRIETIGGDLQSQLVVLRPVEISNPSNDKMQLHYSLIDENLQQPFEISEGIVIPVGEYSFDQYCARVSGAEFRPVSGNLYYCGGDFYDGTQLSTGASVVWRPSSHFKFELGYNYNDIDLPQGAFITRLMSARADIAFTNTFYWENFVQYDNVSYSLGLNSILRWVPRAGRELVFVVNREYVDFTRDNTFTTVSGDMTFKFAYTFRF